MSSTSSRDQSNTSATESLARRYRHLFVLPSASRLLIYGGLAALAIALVSRGTAGLPSFILAYAVFVLASTAIASALRIADGRTIANVRRVSALLLGGEILWLVFGAIGVAYARFVGSSAPVTNALVFGAFICAGFEFLIIYGAFTKNSILSLALSALFPAVVLYLIRYDEIASRPDFIPFLSGAAAFAVIAAFPHFLRRGRTSRGYDSLTLFQAFMKTWTAGYADELETIIADHSEKATVATKVFRFRSASGDIFLVLPGVHPGPFHPVGSYDLPGVVARELKDMGPVLTMHKPGGHEHNLATRADTLEYAGEVKRLAKSITSKPGSALLKGPLSAQIGKAKAGAVSFSNDAILTVSFAPLGSDDLDTKVETDLARTAAEAGLDLSVVDAHNSIDHVLETPVTDDPGWMALFAELKAAPTRQFDVAYAHSSELGFKGGRDITENGIGMLMIRSGEVKSVLILADANNSVPSLRDEVTRALASAGYELLELCTSDSHNLAARGATVERGYEALGEATPTASIADLAVNLAKMAEPRLSRADLGVAHSKAEVRVFGSKALNEFAVMTQDSSAFARRYLRFASTAVGVLFLLSAVL
ncbi:MAG: DUF2070 family protein [Nitrososphaerota archaeon]|nr:DUF2070 family protein [Nitrososphaerota archaeon]